MEREDVPRPSQSQWSGMLDAMLVEFGHPRTRICLCNKAMLVRAVNVRSCARTMMSEVACDVGAAAGLSR
jgi:hypothetical protein